MISRIIFAFCAIVFASAEVFLLSFDGVKETTSTTWTLTNDPVMGGLSFSNWTVDAINQKGIWEGTVKIVPSLDAPGFCNIMSAKKTFWNDASGNTHLLFKVKSTIPYDGFKVSFAADTLNMQFKCFKADFKMASTGEWEEIAVPFNEFSNNWSSYTGEPIVTCAADPSVCPTEKNLKDISQIGFWMEGAEGPFQFEVANVRAGKI